MIIYFILLNPFQGFAAGRLPGIDSSSRFLVYYGNDFSHENLELMTLYDNTQRIHIFLLGENFAYPEGNSLDQYPDAGLRRFGGGPYFTYSTQ
jgi:hypothetical protein